MTANPPSPDLTLNPPPAGALRHLQKPWVISILLVLLTLIPYAQMLGQNFVNYDDDLFITRNPHINHGLTRDAVNWAFGFQSASQYHPLTTLSHALDCEVFGLNPIGPKAVNLTLHLATTVLIFRLALMMTGRLWPCAVLALLCGIHPLRVEAVAWIAERKEMLSNFFGVLTIISYVWYTRRRNIGRYLLMLLLYTLTLMSKPMLVTMPFILLLLDYRPLRRFDLTPVMELPRKLLWLVLEKLPMFPLLIASSYLTWRVVQVSGAAHSLEATPVAYRLTNVIIAYGWYIYKTFVPLNLTCLYLFDPTWSAWEVTAASAAFFTLTYLAIRYIRKLPYLFVGWFFFVGTLVPVIGLVQVGAQAYADRYSYVGQIGLFIMIIWGAADLIRRLSIKTSQLVLLLGAVVVVCLCVTWLQVSYWYNSKSLFTHALDVNPDSSTAHNNLGSIYLIEGNYQKAAEEFFAATKIFAYTPEAWNNLGQVFILKGDYDSAIEVLRVAFNQRPDNKMVLTNLGIAFLGKNDLDKAVNFLQKAIQSDPFYGNARYYMAVALKSLGRFPEAREQVAQAIKLQETPEGWTLLADIYSAQGDRVAAMEAVKNAIRLSPNYEPAKIRIERLNRGEPTEPPQATTQPASQPATQPKP